MALQRYRSVARGDRQPAYVGVASQRIMVTDLPELDTEVLWALHDAARSQSAADGPSLLDVKIEIARRMLSRCNLCERRCGANRAGGETGFCGVGQSSHCFFEQVLWGEEAPLNPSHEVFFSGCNMRCKFCYAWESVVDPNRGDAAAPGQFASLISARRQEGALNVNLIGGEPTVHIPTILQSLREVETQTAVVWNSNFLMSGEAMRLLDGVVDLYVGDFRFGNNCCASTIAETDGYFETAARNFLLAAKSGEVIIRHLLLPGHAECCLRPIAEWLARNLPETPFHLMFQYLPFHEAANDPALCRPLSAQEKRQALRIVRGLGLNTHRWNRAIRRRSDRTAAVGRGEIRTTILLQPDGRVAMMHLHSQLADVARALTNGGDTT